MRCDESLTPDGNGTGCGVDRWSLVLVLLYALTTALRHSMGFYTPEALTGVSMVLAAWVLLLGDTRPRAGKGWVAVVLALVFVAAVLHDFFTADRLMYFVSKQRKRYRLVAAVSVGALLLDWILAKARRRRRFPTPLQAAAVLLYCVYMGSQILRSPYPMIDVWTLNTEAAWAAAHGENVYGRTYTDIYEKHGQEGFGYPIRYCYLPGLALHYAPAALLRADIRWVNLAAMALGLLLFSHCVGKTLRAPPDGLRPSGWAAAGATLMFWYWTCQTFMLEQSWPEPILLLYLCAAFWLWRRSTFWTGVALVLALTLKQTAWFCAPFLLALAVKEKRWGLIGGVALGVCAVIGPYFFRDPSAFVHDVILDLLRKPPRPESLSWSAVCLRYCPSLFAWVYPLSYVAYAAAFWAFLRRLRRMEGHEAVLETLKWTALGLLAFFLFLKQSFFNYYYVVLGLLAFYVCLAGCGPDAEAKPGRIPLDSEATVT